MESGLSEPLSKSSEEADTYQQASKRAQAALYLTFFLFFVGAGLCYHLVLAATNVDYKIAST